MQHDFTHIAGALGVTLGVSALRRVECERRSGVMRKKGVAAGEAARAKERRMAGREEAKRVMRGWESGGRATGVEVELTAKEQKACCESVSVLLGVRAVCEIDSRQLSAKLDDISVVYSAFKKYLSLSLLSPRTLRTIRFLPVSSRTG